MYSKRGQQTRFFRERIEQRSTTPKWDIALDPTGVQNIANTLEENGVVYADTPVGSNGLQYFEVAVKELRGVHLGVGLFQVKARAQGASHLNIKHSKIWWSDGPLQSFKTKYGTRHLQARNKTYSSGDIIGCGARLNERTIFLTKNGAWLGDYSLDVRSETRLAVFLCPDAPSTISSSRWFDLRISFDETVALFIAKPYLSRIIGAQTRQAVGHAPLPPEVISMILRYVIGKPGKTHRILVARLRLVCSHWSTILWPAFLRDISIRRRSDIEYLIQKARKCSTITSNPGSHINTLSLCETQNLPPLETVFLSSLGAHATQLTQLICHGQKYQGTGRQRTFAPRITSMLPALLRHLRALHTLYLARRPLHSCAQLFSIINALPSLKHLELRYVTIDRVGPVRPAHVAAAAQRLQTFCWRDDTTINQRAAMAAVAARLCTGNDPDASAVAEAVLRAPWTTNWSSTRWAEYTYKADTSGTPESSLNFDHSTLKLKWSIPPAEENSPIRARLLATLNFYRSSPTVELALQDLDPHLRPHYPLTLIIDERITATVPDLPAQLRELMPHAHRLGLITIEESARIREKRERHLEASAGRSG